MPSKSKKQRNLMAAVANNPKFAKQVGIPQSVGKKYAEADKGRKFKEGGPMKKSSCGTKKMARGGKTGAKKVQKYQVGGITSPHPIYSPAGGNGGGATGSVKQVQQAAEQAQQQLGIAGSAIGSGNNLGGGISTGGFPPNILDALKAEQGAAGRGFGMKKGGKVRGAGKATKGVRACKMR